MEPITLCGLVIVMFGLWVEFEPAVRVVAKIIYNSRIYKDLISVSTVQMPAYVRRMPACFARSHEKNDRGIAYEISGIKLPQYLTVLPSTTHTG